MCFMTASFIALSGCAGLTPSTGQPDHQKITRAVKLIGPDQALLLEAKNILNDLNHVDIVPEDSFSDLSLILQTDGDTTKGLFNNRPPIVGILKQQPKPSFLRINYTLINHEGDPLFSGEVVGVGPDQTGYFPSLTAQNNTVNRSLAIKDSLNQLQRELTTKIEKTPFTAKVNTKIMRSNQVSIPVYRHANLTPEHTFRIKDEPESNLRFIGLTQGLNTSQTHALLEVTKGPLPKLGTTLILN